MNEQQLQTVAERLANMRGLSAKTIGTVIDVPIDYQAVIDYVDGLYNYLVSTYDDEVNITSGGPLDSDGNATPLLSESEFRVCMLSMLAKRVQWVRQRVNGLKEGATIQISNTTPLPGPVFRFFYAFGRVDSVLGAVFIPEMGELLSWSKQLTVPVMRKYIQFVSKLKHYYAFSEGMPSQDRGTYAYILHADLTVLGALVSSPSPESVPDDAYLASITRCARVMSGFFYGVNHGIVQSPDIARVEFFDAYGKGIGDGQ